MGEERREGETGARAMLQREAEIAAGATAALPSAAEVGGAGGATNNALQTRQLVHTVNVLLFLACCAAIKVCFQHLAELLH